MLAWSGKSALGLASYCACLPVLAVFAAGIAAAQDTTSLRSMFQSSHAPIPSLRYYNEEEDAATLPVRQRPRLESNSRGFRSGSFLFFPTLAANPFYDSNVFASRNSPQSDSGIIFSPRLAARSDWNNHQLNAEIGLHHYQHFELTSETRTDANAALSGRLDVRRDLIVLASVSAARQHEARGTSNSPGLAAEPVAYDEFDGSVSVTKSFNRIDVSLGASAEHRNYHDVRMVGGGSLDQDFRDGYLFQTGGRVAYVMKPGIRIFGDARYNWRRYDSVPGVNADSQGYNLLAGVEFTLTSLIRGEFGVGYLNQSYDGAGIPDANGFKYSANLIWNPTSLMTVTFKGARTVNETGIAGAPGRIDSSLDIVIDYELRRNIIVSPSIGFGHEDYAGISRSDIIIEPKLKFDYFINRNFSVGAEYAYTLRDSSVSANDFDRHLVSVNAQAKF